MMSPCCTFSITASGHTRTELPLCCALNPKGDVFSLRLLFRFTTSRSGLCSGPQRGFVATTEGAGNCGMGTSRPALLPEPAPGGTIPLRGFVLGCGFSRIVRGGVDMRPSGADTV